MIEAYDQAFQPSRMKRHTAGEKSFVAELFRSKAMPKTFFNYLEALTLLNSIYITTYRNDLCHSSSSIKNKFINY